MMDASPDLAGAQALLDEMRAQGITPQTASYNSMLKKLCLAGACTVTPCRCRCHAQACSFRYLFLGDELISTDPIEFH